MKYKLKIQQPEIEKIKYFTIKEAIEWKGVSDFTNIMLDDIWKIHIFKHSNLTRIRIININSSDYYDFYYGQGYETYTFYLNVSSEILEFIKQITGIEVQ